MTDGSGCTTGSITYDMPTVWAHFVISEVRPFCCFQKGDFAMSDFTLSCGFMFLGGLIVLLMFFMLDSMLLCCLGLFLTFGGGTPLFYNWLKNVIPYFTDDEEDSHEDP